MTKNRLLTDPWRSDPVLIVRWFSADVAPTAWQSSTIVSQAEARVGPAGDAPQRCRGCAAHDQARGHDRARGTEVLTAGD